MTRTGSCPTTQRRFLLTEIDNKQPFTLTAKVTPTFLKTYDAGTLYIYVKEDLWLKMAMEMDERQKTQDGQRSHYRDL